MVKEGHNQWYQVVLSCWRMRTSTVARMSHGSSTSESANDSYLRQIGVVSIPSGCASFVDAPGSPVEAGRRADASGRLLERGAARRARLLPRLASCAIPLCEVGNAHTPWPPQMTVVAPALVVRSPSRKPYHTLQVSACSVHVSDMVSPGPLLDCCWAAAGLSLRYRVRSGVRRESRRAQERIRREQSGFDERRTAWFSHVCERPCFA